VVRAKTGQRVERLRAKLGDGCPACVSWPLVHILGDSDPEPDLRAGVYRVGARLRRRRSGRHLTAERAMFIIEGVPLPLSASAGIRNVAFKPSTNEPRPALSAY
jgi:hypothetical protein